MGIFDFFSSNNNNKNKKDNTPQSKETIKEYSERTGISEEVFRNKNGRKKKNNTLMSNIKKK